MRPTDENPSDFPSPPTRLPEPAPLEEASTTPEPRTPVEAAAPLTVDESSSTPVGNGATDRPMAAVERYALLGELGRGGIGLVLRGHDPRLGRDLALKVLLERHARNPEMVDRFLEEAQINGQLQHPGIVPVHELDRFADGRPYIAMKLVKGRTLADLLQDRPDPCADRPRFLGIFEQVCQTVAYAHAKGVIHRDLKPANVMVGAFGEVLVMDWGLAKVLAPVGPSAEGTPPHAEAATQIRTAPSGSVASGARLGTLLGMGTYGYMPPEQARGEVDRIGARADVFGLGAILCVILTGQPPFVGSTSEVKRQTARGELADAFARLDGCGADGELARLAKACLAPLPEDRPGDAGVVAKEVAAYLAGVQERLRATELERAAAEARAQEAKATAAAERRARQRTVGLAAAALLLVVGGGSWAWLAQQQRLRTDGAVMQSMDKARVILDQAKRSPLNEADKFREALGEGRKAEELAGTGGASAEVRQQAAALVAELETEVETADRDRRLLVLLPDVRGPREGRKFRTDDQGFMVALAEPSADEQFAAAFREWGLDVDATPIEEAAARLKKRPVMVIEVVAALDEWASERWRQKPQGDWQRLAELATALDDHPDSQSRELRAILADGNLPGERALGELSHALLPLAALADVVPGEKRNQLRRLAEQKDAATEPVLGLLLVARALEVAGDEARAERLLRAAVRARPQEVVLRSLLGELMERQWPPRWREAVECYEATRALRPQLGSALARALVQSGRVEDGLALFERLVKEKPDNPWLHLAWGNALLDQGRFKEAEAKNREAIRLQPDDPDAHNNLGAALWSQGEFKDAEAAFREALLLKPDYPLARYNLGVVLGDQGRYKEAEAQYREAIRLQSDYPKAHNNLGNALSRQGRYKEAEAQYREALRLQPDDPKAHGNLGATLRSQGKFKEAEAECREAIRLQPYYPEAHGNLGAVLHDQGRYKEAEAAFREAIRLQPDDPVAHFNLGNALNGQDRHKEAETELREAIRLKPDYLEAYNNLGYALIGQGRHKEAEAELRKAIRLKPDYPQVHSSLGAVLLDQGRFKEAEAECREAIRLRPDDPEAHNTLGVALSNQGRFKEAEAECRQAIRLKSAFPKAHYDLGVVLGRQGNHKEAEAEYREAIRLQPDYPQAHGNLGAALSNQGRFREAIAAFREILRIAAPGDPQCRIAEERIRQCERLIKLDRKLSAVLQGEAEPASAAERLALAELCRAPSKRLHAAASRFYTDAFAADPKLAANLQQQHRYNAACSAALAAVGQGEDARLLPDQVAHRLRRQALDWLKDDLAAYAKLAERDQPAVKQAVRQRLTHWRQDADLASVRDALDRLPEAERQAWRQLWDDVTTLLKQVTNAGPSSP
jgi:serine/threonine-protein kinase